MGAKLPTTLLRRPLLSPSITTLTPSARPPPTTTQVRHATFVPRPRRPYTFTQLVQLSDGSTFTVRTTMPTALLRATRDSRNHVLWQPTDRSLRNVEADEAGKLAAFRERYGREWDMQDVEDGAKVNTLKGENPEMADPVEKAKGADPFDALSDLISGSYKGSQLGGKTAKEQQQADALARKKK
ncbi:putative 50s ribosomal protein [Podospora conica]|nr:putative 50s ribosomal protein [Schizothecium conicum]